MTTLGIVAVLPLAAALPYISSPASALREDVQWEVRRINIGSDGMQANAASNWGYVAGDGSVVVYTSAASNLCSDDTNEVIDVFAHTLLSGSTELISIGSDNEPANGASRPEVSVSRDGRYIAFVSEASNLVPNDEDKLVDVFIRDRVTKKTVLVGNSFVEGAATALCGAPSLSGDGKRLAFLRWETGSPEAHIMQWSESTIATVAGYGTTAGLAGNGNRIFFTTGSGPAKLSYSDWSQPLDIINLVTSERGFWVSVAYSGDFVALASEESFSAADKNGSTDIYVAKINDGSLMLVSVGHSGEACGNSRFPSVSADGNMVAFISQSPDLVANDANKVIDVFIRDCAVLQTIRVSVSNQGEEANAPSMGPPSMASDGRTVVFSSLASNLVVGDTNNSSDVFVAQMGVKDSK